MKLLENIKNIIINKNIKFIIKAVKDVNPDIILENSEIFMKEGILNT